MSESTWATTPIADSFTAIAKAVAGYVLMPTDDEVIDCAGQGIRRAIDRLNMRAWNWALTYSTITFAAGIQEYTLDQAFKAPRNLSIRNTSAQDIGRLRYLPLASFLKECQWATTGPPSYYTGANVNLFGVIRLDLAPDASFVSTYPTGKIWFYRRVQYPSVVGNALDVPSEAVAYIQAFAEGYAADRYAVPKAAEAYARARDCFLMLRSDDGNVDTDWE